MPTSSDVMKKLANAELLLLISTLVLSSLTFIYNPFSQSTSTFLGKLSNPCKEKNYIAFSPFNYAMVDYASTHRQTFYNFYCLYSNPEEERACSFYVASGFYDGMISLKELISNYPQVYDLIYYSQIPLKDLAFLNVNCNLYIFKERISFGEVTW